MWKAHFKDKLSFMLFHDKVWHDIMIIKKITKIIHLYKYSLTYVNIQRKFIKESTANYIGNVNILFLSYFSRGLTLKINKLVIIVICVNRINCTGHAIQKIKIFLFFCERRFSYVNMMMEKYYLNSNVSLIHLFK